MPDSGFVLPPTARLVDTSIAAVSGGKLKFYAAGTTTPLAVYSDSTLSTSLGSTVYTDSAGHPVASSGSSTKVVIYTGSALVKLVVTDSADTTLATYDNLRCSQDTSSFSTSSSGGGDTVGVRSKTADYSVVLADDGYWFDCDPTGATFTITLPSAVTVGDGFTVGIRHAGTATTNGVKLLTVSSQTISRNTITTTSDVLTGGGESVSLVSNGVGWRVTAHTQPRLSMPQPVPVVDRLAIAPSSPTPGTFYITTGVPAGDWAGFAVGELVRANGQGGWIRYVPVSDCGWLAFVQDEDLLVQYRGSAWVDLSNVAAPAASAMGHIHVAYTVADGTIGGAVGAAANTWYTRALNTTTKAGSGTLSGVTLSSNTLVNVPAGTYMWHATLAFGSVDVHQFRIRGTTAGIISYSKTGRNDTADGTYAGLSDMGVFTLSAADTIYIENAVSNNSTSTSAAGVASSLTGVGETHANFVLVDIVAQQGPRGPSGNTEFEPKTYGAIGNGSTNDRAAIVACETAALVDSSPVVFNGGTYLISTNLTLTADVIFKGGVIKLASGVVLTLSGNLTAPPVQIFDVSAGGGCAVVTSGSPTITGDCIYAEWWGAIADRSTACGTALQAALTFQAQYERGVSSSVGGYAIPLQLLTGTYRITAGLTVAGYGTHVRGMGMWSTMIEVNQALGANGVTVFDVTGTSESYGYRFADFQINGGYDLAATIRTAGAGIKMTAVRGATIERVNFRGNFIGLLMVNCKFGNPGKYVTDCYFYGHDGAVNTGSAHIKMAVGATTDDHCSHVHITGCHGDGSTVQYGIQCLAIDTLHMSGNHFFTADSAQLALDNSTGPVINIHSVNNTWETGINSTTGVSNGSYAARFYCATAATGYAYNTLMFTNDQFLNGNTAVIDIDSVDIDNLTFSNCIIQGGSASNVNLNAGSNIKFLGCVNEDANSHNDTPSAYWLIGNGGAPTYVQISNCSTDQRTEADTPNRGIWVVAGSGASNLSFEGCSIKGWNPSGKAFQIDIAADKYKISDCDIGTVDSTIASATTIIVPLGCDVANITGTTTITTIDATTTDNCAFQGRRIHLTFASALTLDTSGNLELAGDVAYVIPAGRWIEFQYDFTDSKWKEVAREKTWTVHKTGALTLANGVNSDITIPSDASYVRITGPSAAFSVTGFAGGYPGRELILHNAVAQDMTITSEATSSATSQIRTLTGANVTLTGISAARFVYAPTDNLWILVGTQG